MTEEERKDRNRARELAAMLEPYTLRMEQLQATGGMDGSKLTKEEHEESNVLLALMMPLLDELGLILHKYNRVKKTDVN